MEHPKKPELTPEQVKEGLMSGLYKVERRQNPKAGKYNR